MKSLNITCGQQLLTKALYTLLVFISLDSMVNSQPLRHSNSKGLLHRILRSSLTHESSQTVLEKRKRNLGRLHHIFKRSPMQNVQDVYSDYYNKLTTFITDLPLKDDTPEVLTTNYKVLLDIIKPTDSSFDDGDFDDVKKRVFLTMDMTTFFAAGVKPYVTNTSWLVEQCGVLEGYAFGLKWSLANYALEVKEFTDVNTALSAINKGIYKSMDSSVLGRLKELLQVL